MGTKLRRKRQVAERRFWRCPEQDRAAAAWRDLERIANKLSWRRDQYRAALRAYGGDQALRTFGRGIDAADIAEGGPSRGRRLRANITRSIVDTLQAEVVEGRPRPMVLTDGADAESREQAKLATQFEKGAFYESKIDTDVGPQCARDALLFNPGVAKIVERSATGRVVIERAFPGDIYVDPDEALLAPPRTLYHATPIDRYVAIEAFAGGDQELEEALLNAKPAQETAWALYRTVDEDSDMILVLEAWHLPSGPDADDGRHLICVDGVALVDEEWEDDSFPFAFLYWDKPTLGFFGEGVPEQVASHQNEHNRLSQTIQAAQHRKGTYWILVHESSGVESSHLNNADGPIVKWSGTQPPVVVPLPALAGEMYSWRSTITPEAYQTLGVSQAQAHGEAPNGESGVARRIRIDKASKRFILWQRAYEEFHVELARQHMRGMRRRSEKDSGYEIIYSDKESVVRIDWKQISLEEKASVWRVFPVSALPDDPEGRMAAVEEMIEAKLVTPEQGFGLLDFPDLEAARRLMNAPRELLEKRFEKMLTTGKYLGPEPFFNLQLCLELCSQHYQYAQLSDEPEERLELFRRFDSDTRRLIKKAAQENQPPAPATSPMPGAPPPQPLAAVA